MVYVFLADGFEDIEALAPIDILRRANVDVKTVGVTGIEVTSSHGVTVKADMSVSDIKLDSDLALIVLPGGMPGTLNLEASVGVQKAIDFCAANDKYIAAICAAPAVVLGKTKIPAGKKWTCYPGMEGESKAEYQNGYSNKVFVTDGNLVTSRGPGAAEEFAMELVRILAGEEVFKKVHDSAQMR